MAQQAGIIQGRLIKLFVGGTAIDDQLDSSLSISADMDEITTKLSTAQWKEFLPSFKGATGSVSGYISFDAAEQVTEAVAAITAGTLLTLLFSTANTGDATWGASAYANNVNIEFPKDGPASFSFDYQITGAIAEAVVS
jgi:hypothetical protein